MGRPSRIRDLAVEALCRNIEDGVGGERLRRMSVRADRDAWSCLYEEGKSETSWERVSKHGTSKGTSKQSGNQTIFNDGRTLGFSFSYFPTI